MPQIYNMRGRRRTDLLPYYRELSRGIEQNVADIRKRKALRAQQRNAIENLILSDPEKFRGAEASVGDYGRLDLNDEMKGALALDKKPRGQEALNQTTETPIDNTEQMKMLEQMVLAQEENAKAPESVRRAADILAGGGSVIGGDLDMPENNVIDSPLAIQQKPVAPESEIVPDREKELTDLRQKAIDETYIFEADDTKAARLKAEKETYFPEEGSPLAIQAKNETFTQGKLDGLETGYQDETGAGFRDVKEMPLSLGNRTRTPVKQYGSVSQGNPVSQTNADVPGTAPVEKKKETEKVKQIDSRARKFSVTSSGQKGKIETEVPYSKTQSMKQSEVVDESPYTVGSLQRMALNQQAGNIMGTAYGGSPGNLYSDMVDARRDFLKERAKTVKDDGYTEKINKLPFKHEITQAESLKIDEDIRALSHEEKGASISTGNQGRGTGSLKFTLEGMTDKFGNAITGDIYDDGSGRASSDSRSYAIKTTWGSGKAQESITDLMGNEFDNASVVPNNRTDSKGNTVHQFKLYGDGRQQGKVYYDNNEKTWKVQVKKGGFFGRLMGIFNKPVSRVSKTVNQLSKRDPKQDELQQKR